MLQGGSFGTTRPRWLDQWAEFAASAKPSDLPALDDAPNIHVLSDLLAV